VRARLVSPGSPDGPSDLLAGREAREACARRARVHGVRKGPVRRHAPRAGPQGSRLEELPRRRHLDGTEEGNLRRSGRGSGDQRLCSRAVLVAEIDERRRVHAFGHGSSPHAPRTGGQPSGAVLPRQRGFCFAQRGEEASWPARVTSPATVTPRGPWRVAACMRRRTLGYGRQQCLAEGSGSPRCGAQGTRGQPRR